MKKKLKKRNPQDTTLRNIRALKKRVEKLERLIEPIRIWISPSPIRKKK